MKNNIKRTVAVLLAVIMAVAVCGCGGKKEGTAVPKTSNGAVNPEDYRGTTVTFVTWKNPDDNEDGEVIKSFEKKYGITVKIQLVTQYDYINTIAASIASGTQGDIFFENGTFPGSLTVMQPLDAAKLDLNDPIWKQSTIKNSTVDGHPYLVDTVNNIWSERHVCVYNKKLFEENGITSPADYYAAGKWTMATFRKACQDIAALGEGYTGATILPDAFLGACGVQTFTYTDGVFKPGVNDKYYDAVTFLAQLNADGLVNDDSLGFGNGKTGMALTDSFGLKRTGYYPSMNSDSIGVTYVPKWDENSAQTSSGIYRGWGLIKGAKNPVAAGIFLRYYLDVKNYNLEKAFHNKEVTDKFFEMTAEQTDMIYSYTMGIERIVGTTATNQFEALAFSHTPNQVRSYINSKFSTLNYMAQQCNGLIASEKDWVKKNIQ